MVIPNILGIKSLINKIDELLYHRQDKDLYRVLNQSNPEEIVRIIESLPHGRKKTFGMLEPPKAAEVFKFLSPYLRGYVLQDLKVENVFAIMESLESDEATDLVNNLSRATKQATLAKLEKSDPRQILHLVNMQSDTAGGLMKTEMVVGKPDLQAREFIEKVRSDFPDGVPRTSYVYVVDDQGKFLGSFNFNKLFTSQPETKLVDLMTKRMKPLRVDQDQEHVAVHFDAQEATELPVVDKKGALVGLVTADDVIDVMRTEMSEDMYRLLGVSANERSDDPWRLKIRRRFPWLLVNLGTAILAAYVVSQFTNVIGQIVILAAYMPIVAGMGGNAATQTLGVTIRAIALNEVNQFNTWRIMGKEVLAGTTNGVATGLVMGAISYYFSHNLNLSLVLLAAMTINLFIAGLGGTVIPLVMKALRIDPALASTVFVTTLTDVFGFLTFLGLSTIFLL